MNASEFIPRCKVPSFDNSSLPMKSPWYSILDRGAGVPLEILLYDVIGSEELTAKNLIDIIKAAAQRPIRVRINSPGGSVFDGYAIYNALSAHPGGVEVDIDGLAASIASYIAMAGQTIRMADNALLMIHNPTDIVFGDAGDMRRTAALLDKIKVSLVAAYERRLNASEANARSGSPDLAAMMDAETWFTAPEALALGFVDEITAPLRAAALFDTGKFRNVPPQIRNQQPSNMKILNASIIALLATSTGLPLTEASPVNEIENAITALGSRNAQLEADMTAARASHATLAADRDNLTAQFTELTNVANQRQTDLTAAQLSVTNLTAEVTATKALHTSALTNIDRLSALCGVKGIDPNKAIEQKPEAAAQNTLTLKAFNALPHAARNEFIRKGGKLAD